MLIFLYLGQRLATESVLFAASPVQCVCHHLRLGRLFITYLHKAWAHLIKLIKISCYQVHIMTFLR